MLAGLKQGQEKMSKSDPESAIFMEDSEADVNVKLKKAYCPPGQVEVSSFFISVFVLILLWAIGLTSPVLFTGQPVPRVRQIRRHPLVRQVQRDAQ
jgi:hypothetical protein